MYLSFVSSAIIVSLLHFYGAKIRNIPKYNRECIEKVAVFDDRPPRYVKIYQKHLTN